MEHINEKMVKPALIGGVITGIITFLFSLIGGCCCCFLYTLSGIITSYLLTQEYLPSDRDYLISGALSGGIAGFVSWILGTIVGIVKILISGTVAASYMKAVGAQYYSSLYMESAEIGFILFAIILLLSFFISIIIGAAFGAIGAVIYRVVTEEMIGK